ncbi:MAG TPA: tyrosine-type recombinase/integrase [Terriglobia bacterium]|nr:tyrosine-type recombinase/integrase [Terriglobia bacterium]
MPPTVICAISIKGIYTAVRVSELVGISIDDLDLEGGRIFVADGKGDKDRYILFPDSCGLTLKAYREPVARSVPVVDSAVRFRARRHCRASVSSAPARPRAAIRRSAISNHQSALSNHQSALSNRQSSIVNQHSAFNNRQSFLSGLDLCN